jgi:glycerol uptake facilitator-like aquaporin
MQCFFDQFLSTAFFLFVIGLVGDQKGPFRGLSAQYAPYLISFAVYTISAAMSFNCMSPINPARDFGPRIMTFMFGYGWDVITTFNNYFWVPIIGPILGAMFGFGFYLQTIGAHNAEK